MSEPTFRRVFFALWPPEETLQALDVLAADVARRTGGRRMRRDSLHLTLAFIGSVSSSQRAAVQEIAGRIHGEAFAISLDYLGYWSHNRIVWAGCRSVPSSQRRLFSALATGLAAAGFALDKRPYTPHVTLARNARCDISSELEPPIRWRVSDFVLAESFLLPSGARYRLLGRWPLQAAPDIKFSKES